MIKLIASDIDGTLVPDGTNALDPEIFEVIEKLRAQGMQFAAASGRQWHSIEDLFEPVKERIFYIADNGAYIGCHGRSLFINTIDPAIVKEMILKIRQVDGLELVISGPDMAYMETNNQKFIDFMTIGYHYNVKRVPDLMEVEDSFIKVAAYYDGNVEEVVGEIRKEFEGRVKTTISGSMWLDCMALGVNKGHAIQTLQDSLGILPEETMVFGDQLNDIEMLNRAYYSFAIGNARPEVKNTARFQTDINSRQGVLKILKNLL